MQRPEHALTLPAAMVRIAIVAPEARFRDVLVAVADAGTVELAGPVRPAGGEALEALRRLERGRVDGAPQPVLSPTPPDVVDLERLGAADLLAGEVELHRRATSAATHGSFAALVGWTPVEAVAPLVERLAPLGATAVELPRPRWVEPPTLIGRRPVTRPFRPLVEAYGPSRYADVDPTLFAAFAFVLMFGMMFGDVGHGLVVAALALLLARSRSGRFARYRRLWPLPFAAGLSAAAFGALYGEAFGPTGLVPTLWLDPVDRPLTLLAAAMAVGIALLAVSYVIGSVNRWREDGAVTALVSPSGIAGACVFAGGGLALVGLYSGRAPLGAAGLAIVGAGLALLTVGFLRQAGRGGGGAVVEVSVEVADTVVRTATSAVSFVRLGAFGLMHAALGALVWAAAGAVWGGAAGAALAVAVFVAGNLIAFSLELLVAGVQALRLEYYELFSRIFAGEGRTFAPWHIPLADRKEAS